MAKSNVKHSKRRKSKLPVPKRKAAPRYAPARAQVVRSSPFGGVAPPRAKRGRPSVYEFHLLQPGFMIEYRNASLGAVCAAVNRYKTGRVGETFKVAKLPSGAVGVWRLT